jgi:hypothetical protein
LENPRLVHYEHAKHLLLALEQRLELAMELPPVKQAPWKKRKRK